MSFESGPFRAVLRGPDQSRGRRKRGARTAEAWCRGGLPGRPDLLRTACLQLRLLRRGPHHRPPLPRRLRGRALRLHSLSFRIMHHHGLPLLSLHLQGSAGRARAFRGSRGTRQGVLGLPGQRDGREGSRGASARGRPSSTAAATSGASSAYSRSRTGFSRTSRDSTSWSGRTRSCVAGSGGHSAVKMPDVSTAMADEKIKALEKSGADTLISGDSSCLMHLEGRLRRTGHDTRVLHLAQVLDRRKGWLRTWRPGNRPAGATRRTGATRASVAGSRASTSRAEGRAGPQAARLDLLVHQQDLDRAQRRLDALPEAPELGSGLTT